METILFKEDKIRMLAIINPRHTVMNVSYKLANDLNALSFFNNIVNVATKYEEDILNSNNKKPQFDLRFKKNIKEYGSVLNLLLQTLMSMDSIKKRSAAEIAKDCNVFSDSVGKQIIKQLAYLPLINKIKERIGYLDIIKTRKDYLNDNASQIKLRLSNIKSKEIINEDQFINNKDRNDKINEIEDNYDNNASTLISSDIKLMLNALSDKNEHLLFGMAYWDSLFIDKDKTIHSLIRTLDSLRIVTQNNEINNRLKMEARLSRVISESINLNIENVEFENNSIKITVNSRLDDLQLDNIFNIYIATEHYEVYGLSLKEKITNGFYFKYEFNFESEL